MSPDITVANAWDRVLDAAWDRFGGPDIPANNAAIAHPGRAPDAASDRHRQTVDTNFTGALKGMLALLPRFRAQGSGHLATVRSMTAFLPSAASVSYAAAKHALRALHHAAAIEERDGATAFTIIHPSATEAPMLEQEAREEAAAMVFARNPTDPAAVAGIVLKAIRARRLDVYVPANHGRRFGDLAAVRACCGKWWRRMRASAAADSSSAARVRSGWPEGSSSGDWRIFGASKIPTPHSMLEKVRDESRSVPAIYWAPKAELPHPAHSGEKTLFLLI